MTKINKIRSEYQEKLHDNKFDNSDEMNKSLQSELDSILQNTVYRYNC